MDTATPSAIPIPTAMFKPNAGQKNRVESCEPVPALVARSVLYVHGQPYCIEVRTFGYEPSASPNGSTVSSLGMAFNALRLHAAAETMNAVKRPNRGIVRFRTIISTRRLPGKGLANSRIPQSSPAGQRMMEETQYLFAIPFRLADAERSGSPGRRERPASQNRHDRRLGCIVRPTWA